jgi:hypothetical protein
MTDWSSSQIKALQRYDNVVGRWAKKSDGSESLESEKKMKRIGGLG